MNKKAISTLVSTVMMIVISLTLGLSFGTLVVGSLKSSLSPELATCTQLSINSPVKIKSACYDGNNEIKVVLERQFSGLTIDNVGFTVTDQGQSAQWLCSQSCGECSVLNEGETKTYLLSAPQLSTASRMVVQVNGCSIDTSSVGPC